MRWLSMALCLLLLAGCSATGGGTGKRAAAAPALSHAGQLNLSLAQNYLDIGDLETALDRANRAVRSDPGSGDAHAMLGVIHNRIGNPDKAAAEFESALRLAPQSGSILNAHAVWMCERGKHEQADAEFMQALQDPFYKSPMQTFYNAGKCAQNAGQLDKAEVYLRRALELSPQEPSALMTLAEVELALGNIMEARAFVQRRDALGSDAQVLELAARIEDAANNAEAAKRYRQRLRDEFPATEPGREGGQQP